MERTYSFGKIDYNGTGRKNNLVTVEVELKQTDKGEEFTACGNIWNHIKSDIYSGGQNLDEIAKYIKAPLFKKIYRWWKLYHLNGMNAGTIEQDAIIDAWQAEGNKYDYTAACEVLKAAGMYEVEVDGKPYKYGHSWLFRAIPAEDLNDIKTLLHMQ
jgi:hypothetical protein